MLTQQQTGHVTHKSDRIYGPKVRIPSPLCQVLVRAVVEVVVVRVVRCGGDCCGGDCSSNISGCVVGCVVWVGKGVGVVVSGREAHIHT